MPVNSVASGVSPCDSSLCLQVETVDQQPDDAKEAIDSASAEIHVRIEA